MVPGAIELAWGADVYFADRDIHPDEFLPTATRADSSLINAPAARPLYRQSRKRMPALVEDMKRSFIGTQEQRLSEEHRQRIRGTRHVRLLKCLGDRCRELLRRPCAPHVATPLELRSALLRLVEDSPGVCLQ